MRARLVVAIALLASPTVAAVCVPPSRSSAADTLWSPARVIDVEMTFADADYWSQLLATEDSGDYVEATVAIDGQEMRRVGVHIKGNSSANIPGKKKPFKIKFDAFEEARFFRGLEELGLSNAYKDPTMLREKIASEVMNAHLPSPRTNFARVAINGQYWGLYTLVEQVDDVFLIDRFGQRRGNLYKGDPRGDLVYRGTDSAPYAKDYELENNRDQHDWSDLIALAEWLSSTPAAEIAAEVDDHVDLDRLLHWLAINAWFVNLDSYQGSGHNYFLYYEEGPDRFVFLPWDLNEAFGNFSMGMSAETLLSLDLAWVPPAPSSRPLVAKLMESSAVRDDYRTIVRRLSESTLAESTLLARITELANLIRADVTADPNKLYSTADFEKNLTTDISGQFGTIFGLSHFVTERSRRVREQLAAQLPDRKIYVNELMARNETGPIDEGGASEDWVEIWNGSGATVDLSGFGLTDDLARPSRWAFPSGTAIPAGGRAFVWLDGEIGQGAGHAGFALAMDEDSLFLFDKSARLVDGFTFRDQWTDLAFGRITDGSARLGYLPTPTPGLPNTTDGACAPFAFAGDRRPRLPTERDAVVVWVAAEASAPIGTVSAVVDGGGRYEMFDDGRHGDGVGGDGVYGATLPASAAGHSVDYRFEICDQWAVCRQEPDDGSKHDYTVRTAGPHLLINEVTSANETRAFDPAGTAEDFVEIYNPGPEAYDLGGHFLTDELDRPTKWSFPSGTTIPGGGFLVVWLDEDETEAGLHASFRLQSDGEELGLFAADGVTPIDTWNLPLLLPNQFLARQPDGGANVVVVSWATPGASNRRPASTPDLE